MTEKEDSVLREAEKLVYGDRERDYDHPINDFTRTAGVLTALGYRGPGNRDLRPEDIPILQIGVKLSREVHRVKRDNLVDICGYAETRRRVLEYATTPEAPETKPEFGSDGGFDGSLNCACGGAPARLHTHGGPSTDRLQK